MRASFASRLTDRHWCDLTYTLRLSSPAPHTSTDHSTAYFQRGRPNWDAIWRRRRLRRGRCGVYASSHGRGEIGAAAAAAARWQLAEWSIETVRELSSTARAGYGWAEHGARAGSARMAGEIPREVQTVSPETSAPQFWPGLKTPRQRTIRQRKPRGTDELTEFKLVGLGDFTVPWRPDVTHHYCGRTRTGTIEFRWKKPFHHSWL